MSSTANMMPKQLPHGRAPSSRRNNVERPLPCEATAAKQDTPHHHRVGIFVATNTVPGRGGYRDRPESGCLTRLAGRFVRR
jgi:hypothetical protein